MIYSTRKGNIFEETPYFLCCHLIRINPPSPQLSGQLPNLGVTGRYKCPRKLTGEWDGPIRRQQKSVGLFQYHISKRFNPSLFDSIVIHHTRNLVTFKSNWILTLSVQMDLHLSRTVKHHFDELINMFEKEVFGWDLAECSDRLTANAVVATSWVRSQRPPTQWILMGGRWNSVE